VLGTPLTTGVLLRARGADLHEDTVAGRPLQLSQHPQYLPVSGRDAVFRIEFSSGACDIGTLSPVAGHREMEVLVQVDGHQVATRVLHVHLIEQHVGERL
jgi:hypothetical protein